jgi:hypothetical protein
MSDFEVTPEGWSTGISENPSFSMFCDEFTEIAEMVNKLPYGILAILVSALGDIKRGVEEDVVPADWPMYEKIYYFMAGILLIKSDKKLSFSDDDLEVLSELLEYMSIKISVVEGNLGGYLEAKYDNSEGCWNYKVPELFKNQLVEFLERGRNNEQNED